MPRLTDHDYLQNHELLRADREVDNTAFVMLSAGEQWDLFQYYLPHQPHTPAALLAHRRDVAALDPSLPQRAGRAYAKLLKLKALLPEYRDWKAEQPRIKKNAKKQTVIFGQVKPDLIPEQFVKILLQAAREAAEQSRN